MHILLVPTGGCLLRRCPVCGKEGLLELMGVDGPAPLEVRAEIIVRCQRCRALAVPAGVWKRVIGLCVLLPFAFIVACGMAAALGMLIATFALGVVEPSMVVVSLAILGGGFGAARPLLRSLRRLLSRNSLLPLQAL